MTMNTQPKFFIGKIFCLLLMSLITLAQTPQIKTSVDSIAKPLGKLINLKLQTQVDTFAMVQFPDLPKIGSLEVIENYPVDTIKKGGFYEFIKRYGITQYDSGYYPIPRLAVFINQKAYYSDSLMVQILDVEVDTLKQPMFEIKEVMEAPSYAATWYWWVLGILIILPLLYFGGKYLWEAYQRKKAGIIIYKSPLEKALAHFKKLDKEKLLENEDVKTYYTELTDIARIYIEETLEVPAMESTTNELVVILRKELKQKKYKLSQSTLKTLEDILKQADLVKFAKSKPFILEIKEDRNKLENIVKDFHAAKPKTEEEEDLLLEESERALKKKQKRLKYASIGLGVFLLLMSVIVWFTNGFGLFDQTTKKMLEQEWVTSEYGYPGIQITSPDVFERMKDMIPPSLSDLVQEQSVFQLGSVETLFISQLKTTLLKTEPEEEVNEFVLENELKVLEKLGAHTILVKPEDFSLSNNAQGKKNYGTFKFKAGKNQYSFVYQMYLFQQKNTLQQVTVIYLEDDNYGKAIADKMIKSIELKQVK